jgi:pimeloyl-ACP methyl ester carboxylesterase
MKSYYDLSQLAAAAYTATYTATVDLDVHYQVLPFDDEIIVVFPGTHPTEVLDWLRDFSALPIWVKGVGPLHSGFGGGARAAWDKLAPTLPTDRLVTFLGHSLGGALAACTAAIHAYERPGVKFRLVTFGEPRSGFLNPWFRSLLAKGQEVARFARNGDIVPTVPTKPPFTHGSPKTVVGTSTGDWIADHSMANYAIDVKSIGPHVLGVAAISQEDLSMKSSFWLHLGAQIGIAAAGSAVTTLSGADYSSLGAWAGPLQAAAALAVAAYTHFLPLTPAAPAVK